MKTLSSFLLCVLVIGWYCQQYGYFSQVPSDEYTISRRPLESLTARVREVVVLVNDITIRSPMDMNRRCCRTIPGGNCARDFCQLYIEVECAGVSVFRSDSNNYNLGGRNTREIAAQVDATRCLPNNQTNITISVKTTESGITFWQYSKLGLFPNERVNVNDMGSEIGSSATASFYMGVVCDNRMGVNCTVLCIPIPNSVCDYRTGGIVCIPGFAGPNCQIDSSDPCDQNPCLNDARCTRIRGSTFECTCAPGFTGANCELDVCTLANCHRGNCIKGNPQCQCVDDYLGPDCNTGSCTVGLQQLGYCMNNGRCNIVGNYRVCLCDDSLYTGVRCEHQCKSRCLNGGTCIESNGVPSCLCPEGLFDGEFCEHQIIQTSCQVGANPCQNNALDCRVDSEGDVICVCSNGWTGPTCEAQTCDSDNCINGVCVLGLGCACEDNYGGPSCDVRVCSNDYCFGGGLCRSEGSTAQCICDPTRAGDRCEYTCPQDCGSNGVCSIDYNGTPQCLCDFGFYGNDCSKRRESIQCGVLSCENNGICLFTNGEYKCQCNPDFTGTRCELSSCNAGNCNRGVCVLGGGCQCIRGYTGSTCDISICEVDSCSGNGLCQIINNQRSCSCNSNYAGSSCELKCPFGCAFGTCIYHNEELQCLCNVGFFGQACENRNRIKEINGGLFVAVLILLFIILAIVLTAFLSKFVFKTKDRKNLFEQVAITSGLKVFNNKEEEKADKNDLNWAGLQAKQPRLH